MILVEFGRFPSGDDDGGNYIHIVSSDPGACAEAVLLETPNPITMTAFSGSMDTVGFEKHGGKAPTPDMQKEAEWHSPLRSLLKTRGSGSFTSN